MKYVKFFKVYYEIAFEMRYRAVLPYWLKWLRDFILFFQIFFFSLDFCPIQDLIEGKYSILKALNNTFMINSWIYYAETPLSFSLLMFIFNLIFIASFLHCAIQTNAGKYNSITKLYCFAICLDFICPIVAAQSFLRFNQQLILTLNHFTFENLMSMFLLFFVCIAGSFVDYLDSIFIQPRIIMINSIVDMVSCNTNQAMYWIRFMIIHTQILLSTRYHYLREITVFWVYASFCYYTVLKRIFTGAHYSIFGAVLLDSPIFAHPIVMFCQIQGLLQNHLLSLNISLIIIYIAIYIAYNKLVMHYAPSIFEKKDESTHFAPVSNALVLRICAEKEANIDLFENYMLFRMKEDPDEVIEVLRFLGIFRSFRSQLLMMLSMKKCDDSYYNYQFYAFTRVFKSYSEPTPQNYIVNLDQMHRSYLVNLSLYWNNRYNGNRFKTLIHGINTAVLHVELTSFIKYLCFIYQYDPYIIQSYSEIALVAMGQPKLSAYYKHHFNKLLEHSKPIIDPIFKKMSHYYPISLERYLEETKRSNGDSYNGDISYGFESTALRFHVDDNTIYRDSKSDSSVTAMFVTKNTKLSSFGLLINIILTLIWGGFFIKFDTGDMKNFKNEVTGIYNSLNYFNNLSENLTTGIILPQLLFKLNYERKFEHQKLYSNEYNIKIPNKESDQNIEQKSNHSEITKNIINKINLQNKQNVNQKENTKTNYIHQISSIFQKNYIESSNCSKYYYRIYGEISNYLTSIRNDYNYYVKILSELSIYLTDLAQSSSNVCEPLNLLANNFSYLTFEILNEFSQANSYLNDNMTRALDYLKDVSTVNFFTFLLLPSVFLGSLVIFLVVLFHLRLGLREIPKSSEEFLGSRERLGLLLFKKSLESWDLFKMLFPLSKDGEDKNIGIFELYNRQKRHKKHRLTKYSSETNVTREKSRHIDLKDSKLAISFIGANEFLHPQNFGLMSPFVSTSTSNSGETSENSDSFTDSSLIGNSRYVATESLENLEIVSAATKIAKFEKKYFLANLLPIVIFPWIATFVIIAYARVITKFSHEVNIERLNTIKVRFARVQKIIQKVNKSLHEIKNPWDEENKPMNITLSEFGFSELVTYKNLPHALNIFIKLNSEIMEDIDQISLLPMNGSIAFTVYSIVFFFLVSYGVWMIDIKCSVGFDSLFHFPIGFVEEMNKPQDLSPPLRLAGNVLELNINIYTGYINYVSSNSPQIIGLEPIDIIGRKYDEMFVKDSNENRIFTYPQTRKTKKFIECRYNKKHVTYIALYDRNNDSQSFENLLKTMIYYVPSKISKNFVDGGVSHYQMKKCFIILVHFDNECCNSQTDQVFAHLFNCLQCFSTVNILRVEGSCIYFIVDGNEASVPLLFIRDVIFGFKSSSKSQNSDLEKMFLSIVITKSDFVADINYRCEPYVHVNYSHCNLCHSLCFSSPLHSVVFLGNCIDLSPFDISKKTTKLSGNSTAVPFSLFYDIVNCLY